MKLVLIINELIFMFCVVNLRSYSGICLEENLTQDNRLRGRDS